MIIITIIIIMWISYANTKILNDQYSVVNRRAETDMFSTKSMQKYARLCSLDMSKS